MVAFFKFSLEQQQQTLSTGNLCYGETAQKLLKGLITAGGENTVFKALFLFKVCDGGGGGAAAGDTSVPGTDKT